MRVHNSNFLLVGRIRSHSDGPASFKSARGVGPRLLSGSMGRGQQLVERSWFPCNLTDHGGAMEVLAACTIGGCSSCRPWKQAATNGCIFLHLFLMDIAEVKCRVAPPASSMLTSDGLAHSIPTSALALNGVLSNPENWSIYKRCLQREVFV